MFELLALVITLHVWHILLLITIAWLVVALYVDSKEAGGYIQIPGCSIMWLFGNLVMWLIYFIIA